MSDDKNAKSNTGYVVGAVIIGIFMSNIVSDALATHPLWMRMSVSAVVGGVLAGVFIMIVNRITRS